MKKIQKIIDKEIRPPYVYVNHDKAQGREFEHFCSSLDIESISGKDCDRVARRSLVIGCEFWKETEDDCIAFFWGNLRRTTYRLKDVGLAPQDLEDFYPPTIDNRGTEINFGPKKVYVSHLLNIKPIAINWPFGWTDRVGPKDN